MKLTRIHLENFRNIAQAAVELPAMRIFLLGANGQGKSNFLEAAGMITAMRSFRTHELRPLIRNGNRRARVYFEVETDPRDDAGQDKVTLTFTPGKREAEVNGVAVPRLADYIGNYPTVALSAEDIRLLRGAPALRRRFLDLTLAVTCPGYLRSLSRYHQALRSRNALLKGPQPESAALAAYDSILAPEAVRLVSQRGDGLKQLKQLLSAAYSSLAGSDEEPDMVYLADSRLEDEADMRRLLEQSRTRDLALRTTTRGPHRDDWEFRLQNNPARDFASDGQQRSLVLALRLAQFDMYRSRTGRTPVLLADDVLGELDPGRKQAFWQFAGNQAQVIASGTTRPDTDPSDTHWLVLQVHAGSFSAS